jgi:predicted Zn-dependent peptidase
VPLSFLPGTSIVTLGGSFAPKTGVGALHGMLQTIRAARETDVSEGAIARAKRTTVAVWRHRDEDWATMAFTAEIAAKAGNVAGAFDLETRIAAVTAADVRRVTRRYLGEESLRAVLIGKGPHFAGLEELGLGGAGKVDAFGRPLFRAPK